MAKSSIEEMAKKVADEALDSIYMGKTLREWIDTVKQTRWIPVSERLPEKMGTYLVTLNYKEHGTGVTTLWFHNAEIGWDLRVADVVVAWMPLPEAYAESEEEK